MHPVDLSAPSAELGMTCGPRGVPTTTAPRAFVGARYAVGSPGAPDAVA